MKNSLKQNITWKTLYRADKTIKVPFQLSLSDTNELLLCQEVIRIIPGKRLVAFGLWNNTEVAIKLFYEKRKAKRDCSRDVFGVEALMQANVPTPKLFFKGAADNKRIHVLIYEKITEANSIETLWQEKKSIADLAPLMHAVTIEIATQHVLGILQHDLHLKNFLVTDKCIYTLDGGKISKFDHPLDKNISMEYLSLFLVQLGVGVSDLQQELFDAYTKSRGWLIKSSDIKFFNKMMARNNQTRWQRYKKKIFRNCSSFKRFNKINKSMMYDRGYESSEFIHFLQNPEKFLNQPTTVFLKPGRSSTVAKVIVDKREFVVKRYNIKDTWHWFRRCLRLTRAVKSWRVGQHMYASGVATAKPVAYIEHHILGLRGKSYFIMEYIEGQNIGNYFAHCSDEQSLQMAKNILELFNSLFELRITHGDLKMTNILIENERPVLIDLDGVQEHHSMLSLRYSFKNEMKRFMQNWENQPRVRVLFEGLMGRGYI